MIANNADELLRSCTPRLRLRSRIEGITEQIATRLTSLEQKVEHGFSETRQTARTDFRWLI